MMPVAADARIADRYRLIAVIGSGGMGSVWRAEDEILKRPVAVKLLRPEFASDQSSRSRLRVEAQAAASINQANVVAVYDYGEEVTADGQCLSFVVMELVDGRSLAEALAERGRLDPATVGSIVEQAALGLAAAHKRGIVHRDIKPGNLLLSRNGTVKITDFGIARVADAASLTRTGTMLGTAQYLSPEQATGTAATPASDLYSLGVVAYACLTGAPPFDGGDPMATLSAHAHQPVPALPSDIPASQRRLVEQLLAKRPQDRPRDALEVAARAASAERTEVLPQLPAARRSRSRHRWVLIAIPVVAGLIAVAVLGLAGQAATRVPLVTGQQASVANLDLTRAGYKPSDRTVDNPRHPQGYVLSQSPAGGQSLRRGQTVVLLVSSGRVMVDSNSYVGVPYNTVASQLSALGLRSTPQQVTSPATPGSVVSVTPSGEVPVGSALVVQVAVAPPPLPAPPPPHGHGHGDGGDH
jgi:eukaryotic-like serine/threonine-protein kinase